MIQPDPTDLLQKLIRCPSVTPDEGGALALLQDVLGPAGFECARLPFTAADTPDVDNLFARFGTSGKHLAFAGHTDVVPPGDAALWSVPPFAGATIGGVIYGRGACDMKGSIAAFTAAALKFTAARGKDFDGSISLIITGDEEGPAINGTVKMLKWMADNSHTPDDCVVGEPTCMQEFGDTIKIGRRGSQQFTVTVKGVQGHVAYPQKADNPIPKLARLIDRLANATLDDGNQHFDPSTLSVSTFDVGNKANNVIPEQAVARFNIRFNTEHTPDSLTRMVNTLCDEVAQETGGRFFVDSSNSAQCFITEPGPLVAMLSSAIQSETGTTPALSTSGGTSDARFIKDYCPVVEFGPLNDTIHATDERIEETALHSLSRIYHNMLEQYFA